MNGRRIVTGAILMLLLGGITADAGGSAAGASGPSLPVPLPSQLQALEQKMGLLQINSERYSTITRGAALITSVTRSAGGRRTRHTQRISENHTEVGIVSLAPGRAELFKDGAKHPALIVIGSNYYLYRGTHGHGRRARPWVRFHSPANVLVDGSFPFHGGSPAEVVAGGTGSYAGLINLLSTAVGSVSFDGQVAVRGQQTSEFTGTVEPFKLIKGLSPKELEVLDMHPLPETLTLFVTEAGLPIRVVTKAGSLNVTSTTEVLAVDIPVSVKAPPRRATISISALSPEGMGRSTFIREPIG